MESFILRFCFPRQVPSCVRPPGSLRVPGHPQHPPVLRHQEGREKEAEAHGKQGQVRTGGARQEVNKDRFINYESFKHMYVPNI